MVFRDLDVVRVSVEFHSDESLPRLKVEALDYFGSKVKHEVEVELFWIPDPRPVVVRAGVMDFLEIEVRHHAMQEMS